MHAAGVASVIATASALAIAARQREATPAAVYIAVRSLASLARIGLVGLVLAPARARMRAAGIDPVAVPFSTPLELAAVALDGTAWLAEQPVALAALAVAVFTRHPRRWLACVGFAWLVGSVALALGYPATRGANLARCYIAAALVSLVVSLVVVVRWAWERRDPKVSHSVAIVAIGLVLAEYVAPDGGWVVGDPFRVGVAQGADGLFFVIAAIFLITEGVSSWVTSSSQS